MIELLNQSAVSNQSSVSVVPTPTSNCDSIQEGIQSIQPMLVTKNDLFRIRSLVH